MLPPSAVRAQAPQAAPERPLSLDEAYTLALAKSETLAIGKEGLDQLEAARRRLASAFRPSLELGFSHRKRQNYEAEDAGYLSAGYSLFSGMRDYIALKAASASSGAAELDLARARQELYLGVADAYFGLLSARKEKAIRNELLEVTRRRVAELEARVELGRSRKSEAAAAKAQLAQDKAGFLEAAAAERLGQEAMSFLTGLPAGIVPAGVPAGKDEGLETYLKSSLSRPDVAAKRRSLEAYGHLRRIQDRNTWPSVSVSGDYYALRHPKPDPDQDWTAGLVLSLPLYTGGAAGAMRASAASAERAAELALKLAERRTGSEVRSAYEEFRYAGLRRASLQEAADLAAENERYQESDYKLGLVTNLDVLNAINSMQQTRLALSQAETREALAFIRLRTAAGMETPK